MSVPRYNCGAVELVKWMSAEGHSQAWVAEQLGCNQATVSLWVNGNNGPGLALAHRLEELAGIAPKAWLTDATPADEAGAAPAVDAAEQST